MRKVNLNLALSISIFILSTSALAKDAVFTEEGAARTASLYFAIAEYCPSFFKVDKDLAIKLGEAVYGMGMKTYGYKKFYKTAGKEFDRRKKEVSITDPKHWCDYQYSHQKMVSGSTEANPFTD